MDGTREDDRRNGWRENHGGSPIRVDDRDNFVGSPRHVTGTEAEVLDRLRVRLDASAASAHDRSIVGICGPPGAGKSHLAAALADALGPDRAVVVPFDGFHLATSVIEGTPLMARRGAIDTFDLGAFRAMIERLRRRDEPVVYAPSYRRGLEDPIASAIPVARDIPIVITEGNYLLADAPELLTARAQLDEVWYLDTSDSVRLPQLIARHVAYGMGADTATAWASGPDQRNAELIELTRHRADLVITIERSDGADASSTNGHTPRTA